VVSAEDITPKGAQALAAAVMVVMAPLLRLVIIAAGAAVAREVIQALGVSVEYHRPQREALPKVALIVRLLVVQAIQKHKAAAVLVF
jgi:hypothetical protein